MFEPLADGCSLVPSCLDEACGGNKSRDNHFRESFKGVHFSSGIQDVILRSVVGTLSDELLLYTSLYHNFVYQNSHNLVYGTGVAKLLSTPRKSFI